MFFDSASFIEEKVNQLQASISLKSAFQSSSPGAVIKPNKQQVYSWGSLYSSSAGCQFATDTGNSRDSLCDYSHYMELYEGRSCPENSRIINCNPNIGLSDGASSLSTRNNRISSNNDYYSSLPSGPDHQTTVVYSIGCQSKKQTKNFTRCFIRKFLSFFGFQFDGNQISKFPSSSSVSLFISIITIFTALLFLLLLSANIELNHINLTSSKLSSLFSPSESSMSSLSASNLAFINNQVAVGISKQDKNIINNKDIHIVRLDKHTSALRAVAEGTAKGEAEETKEILSGGLLELSNNVEAGEKKEIQTD